MMTTIDELIMYSFMKKCNALLRLAQDGKIKKIYTDHPKAEHIVQIELYKDTFKGMDFDKFLDEMMLGNIDYQIKIIGKRIFIFIHLHKGDDILVHL